MTESRTALAKRPAIDNLYLFMICVLSSELTGVNISVQYRARQQAVDSTGSRLPTRAVLYRCSNVALHGSI